MTGNHHDIKLKGATTRLVKPQKEAKSELTVKEKAKIPAKCKKNTKKNNKSDCCQN